MRLADELNGLIVKGSSLVKLQADVPQREKEFIDYILTRVLAKQEIFDLYQFLNHIPNRAQATAAKPILEGHYGNAFIVRRCTGFDDNEPVLSSEGFVFQLRYSGPPRITVLDTSEQNQFHPADLGEHTLYCEPVDTVREQTSVYNTLVYATRRAQEGVAAGIAIKQPPLEARIKSLADEMTVLQKLVRR